MCIRDRGLPIRGAGCAVATVGQCASAPGVCVTVWPVVSGILGRPALRRRPRGRVAGPAVGIGVGLVGLVVLLVVVSVACRWKCCLLYSPDAADDFPRLPFAMCCHL